MRKVSRMAREREYGSKEADGGKEMRQVLQVMEGKHENLYVRVG